MLSKSCAECDSEKIEIASTRALAKMGVEANCSDCDAKVWEATLDEFILSSQTWASQARIEGREEVIALIDDDFRRETELAEWKTQHDFHRDAELASTRAHALQSVGRAARELSEGEDEQG